jgi:hypothetical protein
MSTVYFVAGGVEFEWDAAQGGEHRKHGAFRGSVAKAIQWLHELGNVRLPQRRLCQQQLICLQQLGRPARSLPRAVHTFGDLAERIQGSWSPAWGGAMVSIDPQMGGAMIVIGKSGEAWGVAPFVGGLELATKDCSRTTLSFDAGAVNSTGGWFGLDTSCNISVLGTCSDSSTKWMQVGTKTGFDSVVTDNNMAAGNYLVWGTNGGDIYFAS